MCSDSVDRPSHSLACACNLKDSQHRVSKCESGTSDGGFSCQLTYCDSDAGHFREEH